MTNRPYFFLYLKTGGGHLAPASSVTSLLKTRYPEIHEPVLIDGLGEAPAAIRRCIEDGYRLLQAYGRWIYALLYYVNKWPFVARANARIVSFFVTPYLERRILSELPEKIVIFHFFLIRPVKEILARHALAIPTLVVVTDPFTAHPLWFLDKDHHFIVFSEQLRTHCLQKEIRQDRLTVFPFILNERFGAPAGSKDVLRRRWGFHPERRLILIIGGADGIPKGTQIVKHLLRRNPEAEIAVVCGKNHAMRERIAALKASVRLDRLHVFGYVDSVHEILQASDIVITKCGASMFMETLFAGKIPIVNNYLWEQEKGNVDYLCQNRMGIYEQDTEKLSSWVHKLFSDAQLFDSFHQNIARAHLVNGVHQVSDYIVRFNAA